MSDPNAVREAAGLTPVAPGLVRVVIRLLGGPKGPQHAGVVDLPTVPAVGDTVRLMRAKGYDARVVHRRWLITGDGRDQVPCSLASVGIWVRRTDIDADEEV